MLIRLSRASGTIHSTIRSMTRSLSRSENRYCLVWIGALLLLSPASAQFSEDTPLIDPMVHEQNEALAPDGALRVMCFNLRLAIASDGDNRWAARRDLALRTIRNFDPDVLAVQECLPSQADWLKEALLDYAFIGVGRDDGAQGGEIAGLFLRSERVTVADADWGTIWLSPTPDVVGSMGWDAAYTRTMTWATVTDLRADQQIALACTHFDHRGVEARLESARLIRRDLWERFESLPIILMGDFNATPGSGPYRALTGEDAGFLDTFLAAGHTDVRSETDGTGTFHGFDGGRDGNRIDWILVTPDIQTIEAGIDRTHDSAGESPDDSANAESRYPSDHFPVTAVVVLQAEESHQESRDETSPQP